MRVNKSGCVNVIYKNFNFKPDEIYINGIKQSNISEQYNLITTENYIKLVWYNKLNSCDKMFYECSDINEIDLSNFDSSSVTSISEMFYFCSTLTSINLSNFETSNVTDMTRLFCFCESLSYLDLSSFDTSQVKNMEGLFFGCNSLISIDISYFNTSLVLYIDQLFGFCSSLSSLNLSNFDTSNVEKMYGMFRGCSSLSSLNLSNFNTSNVKNMHEMFYGCSSLSSLNLSNFNTPNVNDMKDIFYNCTNLEYLNIKNFVVQPNAIQILNMFTTKNLVLCIENEDIISYLTKTYECIIISCSDDWKKSRKKINPDNDTCTDTCKEINKYEYNGKCYNECPENKTNSKIKMVNDYYCKKMCLKETPFLIIDENICVNYCSINDIINEKCFLSYNLNDSKDIMMNNIIESIKNNDFPKEKIENGKLTFNEKEVIFSLSKLNPGIDNNDILSYINNSLCENSFKNMNNNIYIENNAYLLTIEITLQNFNTSKKVYEIFYPLFNTTNLTQLNLNLLDDNCFLKTEISKCEKYSIESINNDKCISCKNDFGYYPLFNYSEESFINCFRSPEGYYLDIIENVYKPCYQSCKTCDKEGNEEFQNCIECKDEYKYNDIFESKDNYKNCYISKPEKKECDKNNTKLIPEKNICINSCKEDDLFIYEYNNICYSQCPSNTILSKKRENYCELNCPKELPYEHIDTQECIKNCNMAEILKNKCILNYQEENQTKKEDIGKKIVEEILSGNLGELLEEIINTNSDISFKEEYALHQISSLNYQKGNQNLSSIDFGECEEYLRKTYHIDEKEELIIYKIEHKIEGFKIPIIEYVLFSQNGSISLDLSICNNMTVQYDIPVKIDEDQIFKYDPSSEFYNDICYKYSSDGKVDMTIYDRKNEFNNNNLSLCESQCAFIRYNSSSAKAICDCHIKNNMTYSYTDINLNDLLSKIESGKVFLI